MVGTDDLMYDCRLGLEATGTASDPTEVLLVELLSVLLWLWFDIEFIERPVVGALAPGKLLSARSSIGIE